MQPSKTHTEELIVRWQEGDKKALDSLLTIVYSDMRAMAARFLEQEDGQVTLQPTALVNDVLLRILGAKRIVIGDGAHLFNTVSRMMRNILVDRSRALRTEKHGAGM